MTPAGTSNELDVQNKWEENIDTLQSDGHAYIKYILLLPCKIIVPSNHTRIGAWVNSKVTGRNPVVYCTILLIAMQGYQTKTENTISLDYNSIC